MQEFEQKACWIGLLTLAGGGLVDLGVEVWWHAHQSGKFVYQHLGRHVKLHGLLRQTRYRFQGLVMLEAREGRIWPSDDALARWKTVAFEGKARIVYGGG